MDYVFAGARRSALPAWACIDAVCIGARVTCLAPELGVPYALTMEVYGVDNVGRRDATWTLQPPTPYGALNTSDVVAFADGSYNASTRRALRWQWDPTICLAQYNPSNANDYQAVVADTLHNLLLLAAHAIMHASPPSAPPPPPPARNASTTGDWSTVQAVSSSASHGLSAATAARALALGLTVRLLCTSR